jgi:hypothetical protein
MTAFLLKIWFFQMAGLVSGRLVSGGLALSSPLIVSNGERKPR